MKNVSIIIISYNTKDLLVQCLESIYKETKEILYEIIVVDNGSFDDSCKAVKENYLDVILIENKENLGFAKAANIGAVQAKGLNFLFLNTDTVIKENAIKKLCVFISTREDAGICGPQLLNANETLQNSVDNFPSPALMLFNKTLLRGCFPKRFPNKRREFKEPANVESLVGACLMIKREVFDLLKGFDEDYFFFFEETDLCLRSHKNCFKVFLVPQAQVVHFQGASSASKIYEVRRQYFKSRYIFLKKHGYKDFEILVLKFFLVIKLFLNFIFCFLGSVLIFDKKLRQKAMVYFDLMVWHVYPKF